MVIRAEGHYRIDPRRTHGRKPAGEKRNRREQDCATQNVSGSSRPDLEQERFQEARKSHRTREANDDSHRGQAHTLADDQPKDVALLCPERYA